MVTATDGTYSGLLNAFNLALSTGDDTLLIPSGDFVFDNGTGQTFFAQLPNYDFRIFGAGKGLTNIHLNESENIARNTMFRLRGVNPSAPKLSSKLRVSGISFHGKVNPASPSGDVSILIEAVRDFRVDNCAFYRMGSVGVQVWDHNVLYPMIDSATPQPNPYQYVSQGVVDHSDFINNYKPQAIVTGNGYGYGVDVGILSTKPTCPWVDDIRTLLGNPTSATYVEDCYFSGNRHSVACSNGGRYTFRRNMITSPAGNEHILTGHPARAVNVVGMRCYEVYDNLIDGANPYLGSVGRGPWWKSGGGIFANNTIRNLEQGIHLCNSDTDSIESPLVYPLCKTHDLWIYGNQLQNTPRLYDVEAGYLGESRTPAPVLNVDFFLREPNVAQDGFSYVPYDYPHPLVSQQTPYTQSLVEGSYKVSVPSSITANGKSYQFDHWESQ